MTTPISEELNMILTDLSIKQTVTFIDHLPTVPEDVTSLLIDQLPTVLEDVVTSLLIDQLPTNPEEVTNLLTDHLPTNPEEVTSLLQEQLPTVLEDVVTSLLIDQLPTNPEEFVTSLLIDQLPTNSEEFVTSLLHDQLSVNPEDVVTSLLIDQLPTNSEEFVTSLLIDQLPTNPEEFVTSLLQEQLPTVLEDVVTSLLIDQLPTNPEDVTSLLHDQLSVNPEEVTSLLTDHLPTNPEVVTSLLTEQLTNTREVVNILLENKLPDTVDSVNSLLSEQVLYNPLNSVTSLFSKKIQNTKSKVKEVELIPIPVKQTIVLKKETNQDFNQKISVLSTLVLELYRMLTSSLLILFVPQSCKGNLCSISDNLKWNPRHHTYNFSICLNFITLFVFSTLYYVELKRENRLIKYLDVNPDMPSSNEAVRKTLENISVEKKNKILSVDKYYQHISYFSIGIFIFNSIVSSYVISHYYMGSQTTTSLITSLLFMVTKLLNIYHISNTEENIFYSSYMKTLVQFNDLDKSHKTTDML